MAISGLIASFIRYVSGGAREDVEEIKLKNEQASDLALPDEQLFNVLCQFVWVQGDPLPLVLDVEDKVYKQQGLTHAGLKRLAVLGLIVFNEQGFVKKGFGKHTRLFYCGEPTKIGFLNDGDNSLDLGHVLLTERGKQLFLSTTISRNQQFYEYVIQHWFQQGMILSSIQIDKNHK